MAEPRRSHNSIMSARLVGAVVLWLNVPDSVPSMLKPFKIESNPAEDASLSGPESIDEKYRYWFSLVVARASRACLHGRGTFQTRAQSFDVLIASDLALLRTKTVDSASGGIRGSEKTNATT